jgi:GNAT superfamily N-acetyltransferase
MFFDDWEQLDRADIRPAIPSDVRAIARIHVDCWRSAYRGILPDEMLDNLSYTERERTWMRLIAGGDTGPFVYVAEHPRDGVVGFMAGNTEASDNPQYPGEVYVVYVDERHEQSDIGRSMMQLAARMMSENGLPGMLAWAIAGSPIEKFYQSLGGEPVSTRERTYGDTTVTEIAFGWSNLPEFLTESPEREPEQGADESAKPADPEQAADTGGSTSDPESTE